LEEDSSTGRSRGTEPHVAEGPTPLGLANEEPPFASTGEGTTGGVALSLWPGYVVGARRINSGWASRRAKTSGEHLPEAVPP
jgi:hypothetical protein